MPIDDLLNNLEDAEKRFVGAEFLAPLIGAGSAAARPGPGLWARVRIAGVVCHLRVDEGLPRQFQGWAVLKAESTRTARFVRLAGLAEVAGYLALFPPVKLILVQKEGRRWLALPAHRGDTRFAIRGLVPVQLCEDGLGRFETIVSRFDGASFWYDKRDPGRSPSFAAYLNDQLTRVDPAGLPPAPDRLHKPGLTREERDAYDLARALGVEASRSKTEVRLADALAHAGAALRAFVERDDACVVTYEVDGRRHLSTIRRDDFTVMTAGICLAGQDQRFDLTSLVGVLRESHRLGQMVWVGEDGLDEDAYRQQYPPEG